MLRGREIVLIALFVSAIWIVVLALQSEPSAYYQICQTNPYTDKERCAPHNFLYVAFWYGGYVINTNTITAAATVAIAYFTWTIKRINDNQLRHSHIVERAYISGGGAPYLETNERIENITGITGGAGITRRVIETRPTGRFNLCINNYGKTAGELRAFSVHFCDTNKVPANPAYERRYWNDWILPGDRARHVTFIDIPPDRPETAVYGRLYYADIFGGRHSCGFINRINRDTGESVPIEAARAYTEERDETNNPIFDRAG
jgi:hypothetical protein